jgi:hypothetical protein
MLENAQMQLAQARSGTTLKEITPGCLSTPLPITPRGPTWGFDVATGTGQSVHVTAWRQPCSGANDAQLLVTFTPVTGTPFVCGSDMNIWIAEQSTDDLFLDVNPNDNVPTSFCGNLSAVTTFVLYEFDNQFTFDDDFSFGLQYESDFGPDADVLVPGYDPTQYVVGGTPQTFAGKLSGSYYVRTRNGEGILLEIGRLNTRKVLFVAWYTYYQGQQRWIFGNIDFAAGITSAVVPLSISTGGQFGTAFNTSQVMFLPWGQATISFPSCGTMRWEWIENGGQSGTYLYERPLEGLEGIACP